MNKTIRNFMIIGALLLLTLEANARHIHYEKYYQTDFCNNINGIMEYKLKDRSRVDCLTQKYAYEVDFGRKGYEAVGQALYYAMETGRSPGILLIRETRADDSYIGRVKKLSVRYKIRLIIVDQNLKYNVLLDY